MTAPTVSVHEDPDTCTRCHDAPRWRTGRWCSTCIITACCVPMADRGYLCPHPSLQRHGRRPRHRGTVGL